MDNITDLARIPAVQAVAVFVGLIGAALELRGGLQLGRRKLQPSDRIPTGPLLQLIAGSILFTAAVAVFAFALS